MDNLPLELLIHILDLCSPSIERVCRVWYEASRRRTHLNYPRLSTTILHRYPSLTSFEGQILCYRTDDLTRLRFSNDLCLVGDIVAFIRLITLKPKTIVRYIWDFFRESIVIFDYKDGRIVVSGSHPRAPYHLLNSVKDSTIDLTLDGFFTYTYLPQRVGRLIIDLDIGQRLGCYPMVHQFSKISVDRVIIRSYGSLGWMKQLIQYYFDVKIEWVEL